MKFKRLFAIILSASMIACLSACGDDTKSSEAKGSETATETVAVETEEATEAATEAETEAATEAEIESETESNDSDSSGSAANQSISDLAKNYDNEHPEKTIIPMLQMGFEVTFKDNLEITYEEDKSNYIVNVWMDGFGDMMGSGDLSVLDSTCKSLEPSFKTMVDTIRRLDSDANMTFNFVNDKDKDEIFFTFYNDKMTYCISDDQ